MTAGHWFISNTAFILFIFSSSLLSCQRRTTQQETNKTISSSTKYIKQLSEIVRGSSRREWLQLDRLKNQLSGSIQRYGGVQKKVAEKSRALLPAAQKNRQIAKNPFAEIGDEDEFLGRGSSNWQTTDETLDPAQAQSQAFLSEVTEDEVESVKQREEAILQIEVSKDLNLTNVIATSDPRWGKKSANALCSNICIALMERALDA
ncbi:hypothetical protein scyTo_0008146 [Scyliorhinus torazame]|uniref:Syntaxin N-terminal domain-containing protein n=1 Tax=Scyliorhinus torazame TaxID=75743 RepID=A0A401P4B0_SCYTO|nr:hypothetical protein [Scyliorhinus torazame]